MQIANAFLANVQVDLGQINFRLAVPWKGLAFGCWDDDETDTCCGFFECDNNCGGNSPATMRVDCFSGPELTNFPDPSWRASIYRPNQFGTNCQGCGGAPIGYLTYGLPTIDQLWPRCNDCASRTPSDCKFYQEPMPDFYIVDPNFGMVYAAGPGPDVIHQPAESGQPCCDEPPYESPCGFSPPFPYRESLRFRDPPAPDAFRLVTMPGSPTVCEPAAYRDVYMRKDLWIMPNFIPTAAGNCIRLLFRVQYQHTFLPIVPSPLSPGQPAPCSCNEVGRCYVLSTGDCETRMAQSEGWYYMDIYGTDTLATVLNKPLRLFRVVHGGQAEVQPCGVEEAVVAALLPPFTGCNCVEETEVCESVPTTSCPNPPPLTDCQDFSGIGLSEVPCSPPSNPVYPVPPQNTHFDFPERLWITI